MRCVSCHKLSVDVICPSCAERLFRPTISRRMVGTLEVVSLFHYSVIEPFLLTKHTPLGYRIYRYLGQHYIAPFIEEYRRQEGRPFGVIGVDEHVGHGYAHTALLTRAIRHPDISVTHGALLARNRVNYAGKTLQYRLDHPRDFRYAGMEKQEVVLVDDIVTTGITLQEAVGALRRHQVDVLFAVTLADAQY